MTPSGLVVDRVSRNARRRLFTPGVDTHGAPTPTLMTEWRDARPRPRHGSVRRRGLSDPAAYDGTWPFARGADRPARRGPIHHRPPSAKRPQPSGLWSLGRHVRAAVYRRFAAASTPILARQPAPSIMVADARRLPTCAATRWVRGSSPTGRQYGVRIGRSVSPRGRCRRERWRGTAASSPLGPWRSRRVPSATTRLLPASSTRRPHPSGHARTTD